MLNRKNSLYVSEIKIDASQTKLFNNHYLEKITQQFLVQLSLRPQRNQNSGIDLSYSNYKVQISSLWITLMVKIPKIEDELNHNLH